MDLRTADGSHPKGLRPHTDIQVASIPRKSGRLYAATYASVSVSKTSLDHTVAELDECQPSEPVLRRVKHFHYHASFGLDVDQIGGTDITEESATVVPVDSSRTDKLFRHNL